LRSQLTQLLFARLVFVLHTMALRRCLPLVLLTLGRTFNADDDGSEGNSMLQSTLTADAEVAEADSDSMLQSALAADAEVAEADSEILKHVEEAVWTPSISELEGKVHKNIESVEEKPKKTIEKPVLEVVDDVGPYCREACQDIPVKRPNLDLFQNSRFSIRCIMLRQKLQGVADWWKLQGVDEDESYCYHFERKLVDNFNSAVSQHMCYVLCMDMM